MSKIEKLTIYTSNTCGYCKQLKDKLTFENIKFEEKQTKDFLKLLFFNDPIPLLHTHNYGFHTATGRHIIETTQEYYYKYKQLEL